MIGQPHGVPEFGAMHDPRTHQQLGLEHAAQLAVDPPVPVEIHPLADEWGTPASAAALVVGVSLADRPAHQRNLKFGSALIRVFRERHIRVFGAVRRVPADHKRLPWGHKRLPFLNACSRFRYPSRGRVGALTRGISWLERLVQVGKSSARNKENAPS
jgi:aminoglycoside phosphotransferase (APT) family kinase protein